jgi:spore coat protein A, manganese oxidase
VDGQRFSSPISEYPVTGSTELWRIIDNTGDAHPIHLHLVNFQVVSRQGFNSTLYDAAWMALNGGQLPFPTATQNVDLNPFLVGAPVGPTPIEMAWKDTIQIMPDEVLTIIVRFAPADGTPTFPFDPTIGPDLVWHCHIVDHEDQDMIRPYRVVNPGFVPP